jgi:hypothetical protein
MKDKTQAQIASLTQTRDTIVKLRTALKNKVNNLFSAHGIHLSKESLSSEKGLKAVLETRFDPLVDLELKILVEQIRALNKSIAELEQTISRESQKLGAFSVNLSARCSTACARQAATAKEVKYVRIKTCMLLVDWRVGPGDGSVLPDLCRVLRGQPYTNAKHQRKGRGHRVLR